MKSLATLIAAASLGLAGAAAHASTHQPKAAANATDYAEGEVRKVDKEAGKITLRHGPIANLDMGAMTMVFRAKEPALLDKVKEGDKVRFRAEKVQGAITVMEIEPAK